MRELAMHRIAQGNIDKFKLLLETDIDPTKRAMVVRLIAEEDEKLEQIARSEKGWLPRLGA